MPGKRSLPSGSLRNFAGQPDIMESSVKHWAFEQSLADFSAYVLEAKKEGHDCQKLRTLLETLEPTRAQHFESPPAAFYELKHLDSDGLKAVLNRAAKIARDVTDPCKYITSKITRQKR